MRSDTRINLAPALMTQDDSAVSNRLFQTLIACDTLAFDRRESQIEAAPQLGNKGRRPVSHHSVELGVAPSQVAAKGRLAP